MKYVSICLGQYTFLVVTSSNYALKRTAADNSSSYGVDALETVMKNFYVDNLLKSVESEEYAVDLIKRVLLFVIIRINQ